MVECLKFMYFAVSYTSQAGIKEPPSLYQIQVKALSTGVGDFMRGADFYKTVNHGSKFL